MGDKFRRIRVGSVSYLNPVPLVWGMLHGAERELVDLSFALPAVCSQELKSGQIEVGLVPVAEIARQGLDVISNVGITCFGAVRSILLVSKVPPREIKTLACDSSSRTSVELARIILRERYGVAPTMTANQPMLNLMLEVADAALIIGDPALLIDPATLPYTCLDLGEEWRLLTGLPMVFAAWGRKHGKSSGGLERVLQSSYIYGAERLDEIVELEHRRRGIAQQLADDYLRKHIRYVLGAKEEAGLEAFLELAQLPRLTLAGRV